MDLRYVIIFLSTTLTFFFSSCGKDSGTDDPNNPNGNGGEQTTLTISPNELTFKSEGEEKTFTITSNSNWTITNPSTWCKIDPIQGNSNTTITAIANPSEEYDDRNFNLTIKAGEITKVVTVTQKKKDAIILTKEKYDLPTEGDNITVEVKSNISYSTIIPEEHKEWIKQIETNQLGRGLETKNLNFEISANPSTDKREGIIVIKDNSSSLADTIHVYQAQKNELILTRDTYNVSSEGETINVELRSNVDYNIFIPEDAQEWLHQLTTKSLKVDQLIFNVDENETYNKRTSQIIIKDKNSNLSDTIHIIQNQRNVFILSENEFNLQSKGGNIKVELQSNVDYNIIIPENVCEWVQQIQSRSMQSSILNFAIKENSSYDFREANILIQNKGGNLSDTIKIRQACKDHLIISEKEIEIPAKGGRISVTIKSYPSYYIYTIINNKYHDVIDDKYYNIIECEKDLVNNELLHIFVYPNSFAIERVVQIVIKNGVQEERITLTQLPYEGDVIYEGNVNPQKDTYLNDLRGFSKIKGNVRINEYVYSVENLSALKEIEGDLYITSHRLGDLEGLKNLERIKGELVISGTNLHSIEALKKLKSVESIHISGNSYLENLKGLEGLENFTGSFSVLGNSVLNSIFFSENFTKCDGDINISGNPNLTSYLGLYNLSSVARYLRLCNGIDLSDEFAHLQSVGNLEIVGNVNGFNFLKSVRNIKITGNIAGFAALTSVSNIDITGKLSGFSSLASAYNISISDELIDGLENLERIHKIELSSKSEGLNNLASAAHVIVNNPVGFEKIQEIDTLVINGVIEENAFNNLQTVKCMTINSTANVYGFKKLKSIELLFKNYGIANGFHALEKVGGNFINYGIIYGFNKLNTVEGDFEQGGRMEGMAEFQNIGGNLIAINNFKGLEHLITINGNLNVDNIEEDVSFKELESLQTIVGNLNLVKLYNRKVSVEGLKNLQMIGGDLVISYCYSFESFKGLENLKKIGGNFVLEKVAGTFSSFDALSNLIEIGGNFFIGDPSDFKELQNFCLEKLEKIGGDFLPQNLTRLQEFKMPSLKEIQGSFILELDSPFDVSVNMEKLQNVQGNFKIVYTGLHISVNLPLLQEVNGSLFLDMEYDFNIMGLTQLQRVTDTFLLRGRYKGIYDFLSLEFVGNMLLDVSNAELKFPVLKFIEHDVQLKSRKDNYGVKEESVYILNSLEEVKGSFSNNTEKAELQLLSRIGGDLTISKKNVLLNNLQQVDGSVIVSRSLDSFSGLEKLKKIGKDLLLKDCELNSLEGFSGLQSVSGEIQLVSCKKLSSLEGLNKLNTSGSLIINDCTALQNIDALLGLDNIQRISIINCPQLMDFCVFKNVLKDFAGDFTTSGNKYNPTIKMILNGDCSPL